MKRLKLLIKNMYMAIFKFRILMLSKKKGKNLFIGVRADINKPQNIEFGDNVRIGHDSRISIYKEFNGTKYEAVIRFGNNVYIGNHFTILCADEVVIENDVLIASYVLIASENHGMDPESVLPYSKQSLLTKPVRLCEGAWIAEKVTIMPGVTVGKKSIIGTGSVVTKDVPPYSIVAGNPAKVIKVYDFSNHIWVKVN